MSERAGVDVVSIHVVYGDIQRHMYYKLQHLTLPTKNINKKSTRTRSIDVHTKHMYIYVVPKSDLNIN